MIVGTPHADPSLFTAGGDEADQWPACGPAATVGESSSNEPMLILGDQVGVERGRKVAISILNDEFCMKIDGFCI